VPVEANMGEFGVSQNTGKGGPLSGENFAGIGGGTGGRSSLPKKKSFLLHPN